MLNERRIAPAVNHTEYTGLPGLSLACPLHIIALFYDGRVLMTGRVRETLRLLQEEEEGQKSRRVYDSSASDTNPHSYVLSDLVISPLCRKNTVPSVLLLTSAAFSAVM